MKTLSVKQPYAGLIVAGDKKQEYRSWAPPASIIGQRIAIHASGRPDTSPEVVAHFNMIREANLPVEKFFPNSTIVGTVIVKSFKFYKKTGTYAWNLVDPVRFEKPIKSLKGRLGLWNYDLPITTG